PVISQQPVSQTNIVGTTANFTVVADGTLPFYYRWYLNGNPMSDNARVTGSLTATLTISNVQTSDAGNYFVTVTNPAGSVTSTSVVETVLAPPTITTQPK